MSQIPFSLWEKGRDEGLIRVIRVLIRKLVSLKDMFPKLKPAKNLIYLDHAATTPVAPEVVRAMVSYWTKEYGNPSSIYTLGKRAHDALEGARASIANLLYAKPKEIVFTAGGTESINAAIFGVAKKYELTKKRPLHVITSTIEHHAVLHSFDVLKQQGFAVSKIEVNEQGIVDIKKLETLIRPETIFISIMYANNEIGSIQPIAAIGKIIQRINSSRIKDTRRRQGYGGQERLRIVFHTDACQAAGFLDMNVQKLNIDLLSANGSKMYGPKQTGFLYIRSGLELEPLLYGGGQERNIRSGTENVAGAVGLATAFILAQKNLTRENGKLLPLRNYFIAQLLKTIPRTTLNGPGDPGNILRLPNNVNITIDGIDGEALLLYLDSYNIAASTGSACTTQDIDPSHVIIALGKREKAAKSSIRFTLGKSTKKAHIDYVLKVLPSIVKELRKM